MVKLKKRPKMPERRRSEHRVYLTDYSDLTLAELYNDFLGRGIDMSEVTLQSYGRYDDIAYYFVGQYDEPDSEFNKRVEAWRVKNNEYEEWYEKNKDAIQQAEVEKKTNKVMKVANELARLEKQKASVDRQIEAQRKKLEMLE